MSSRILDLKEKLLKMEVAIQREKGLTELSNLLPGRVAGQAHQVLKPRSARSSLKPERARIIQKVKAISGDESIEAAEGR